jgi:putative ABC transport system permease protein
MGLNGVGRDVRYAFRSLSKAPGFALGVVGSLVLGIVANTAAFSFINAAVFRPFPGVRDQHELVQVSVARAERFGRDTSSSFDEYQTLRATLTALDDVAAQHRVEIAVTLRGTSSSDNGALVSTNWFDTLGVRPATGRFFVAGDSAAAVIGYDLWQQRFDGDPAVVGQMLMVNGASVPIIGVAPPRFYGIHKGSYRMDVWLPFAMSHLALRDANRRPIAIATAGSLPLTYVGRRRPQATLAEVEAQARVAGEQINAARPADKRGTTASAARVWLNDPARMGPAIAGFMAVPLIVLVIACVNAANLLLARSNRNSREWQMRMALGASRWRIVRQVLAESVLLAALSAAAGLIVTSWALALIANALPVPMPVDVRVLIFTLAVALTTALVFGLGPALHVASRATADPRGLARLGLPSSRSRIRFGLIAAQAALSLGLLATGVQFINTVRSGFGRPLAPDADRLLIAMFNVDAPNLQRAAADDFFTRLLDRAAKLPGVVAAGVTNASPLAGTFDRHSSVKVWLAQDAPAEGRNALGVFVSGDYFQAAATPVIAGRAFGSVDREGPVRTAIVSQALATRYFGSNPLNRSIRMSIGAGPYESGVDLLVVGVVGPVTGERGEGALMVYYPAPIADAPERYLYLRFDESGRFTRGALENAVRDVDYRVPIREAVTLRERRDRSNQEERFIAMAVVALGLFALVLAAGGLYGVVSYLVAIRRREIGVRLALGATRSSVVKLIVRDGLVPTALGAVLGAGGAIAIGLVVRSRLYGASVAEPGAFAVAVGILLTAMVIASLVPARAAANVDPIAILKDE